MSMLPVLMYHGLHVDARSNGRLDGVYSVRPDAFARQLDWLLEHGWRSARLDALQHMSDHGARPLVISFDDGDISNVEVALPLLHERGMCAEFLITSDFIGQPGMLTADGVRTLSGAGMGVGAHGRSHAYLTDLDDAALHAELRDSRNALEALTGIPITSLALPGGRGGERERRAAIAVGYQHLLGSEPGPNRRVRAAHWLQRLAVTRDMGMEEFASLVCWQGLRPRMARARHAALAVPKRVLGNAGYERLRARLL